jgi:hypothetical protein
VHPVPECQATMEFEKELGSTGTDKYFQGTTYYGQICLGNGSCRARQRSCFPCLLLLVQGCHIK